MDTNELEKIVKAGRIAQQKLTAIADAKAHEENKKLIGTCWRYRNNYSCPEKPSDYWWMYTIVTGVDGSNIIAFSFQTDMYGTFSAYLNKSVYPSTLGEKITRAAFEEAFDKQRLALSDACYAARDAK